MDIKQLWISTNWKMTKTLSEGLSYSKKIQEFPQRFKNPIKLFIIPPYTSLYKIREKLTYHDIC